MKEEFLHYVWQTKQFNPADLVTEQKHAIEIIHPGEYNRDSGPDFFNAKIEIDGMLWSGNVEIHVRTSDWNRHRHSEDEAYDNVILHVVYENDVELKCKNGQVMPTLVLRDRIDKLQYVKFLRLYNSKSEIPCSKQLQQIPPVVITSWLSRLLVDRLERKTAEIKNELQLNNNDWEETFYRHLARRFGMKVNAEPFQWLASATPSRVVLRQRNNLLQTEALLFGQSGLLPEKTNEHYPRALVREYAHLQLKYKLQPMPAHHWKFMRLRPGNFPTLRIAQLAALFYRQPHLFRRCMETENISELRSFFDVAASGYWNVHFRFGKISPGGTKHLGRQAIDSVIVNTVAPFKFLYGQYHHDENIKAAAMELLEKMDPEINRITREWKSYGIMAHSAADSQAMLELSKNYCSKRKCLSCAVGMKLLGRKG